MKALGKAKDAMKRERDEIGEYFDGLSEARKAFPDNEEYKVATANSKGRRETELHIKISHLARLRGALLCEFIPEHFWRGGRDAAGDGDVHPPSTDG